MRHMLLAVAFGFAVGVAVGVGLTCGDSGSAKVAETKSEEARETRMKADSQSVVADSVKGEALASDSVARKAREELDSARRVELRADTAHSSIETQAQDLIDHREKQTKEALATATPEQREAVANERAAHKSLRAVDSHMITTLQHRVARRETVIAKLHAANAELHAVLNKMTVARDRRPKSRPGR